MGGRRLSTGFVTVQVLSLSGMPRALCLEQKRGPRSRRPPADGGCVCPARGWRSESGLGSEGEGAGPAPPLWLGPSRLDHSHLLASLPAAPP